MSRYIILSLLFLVVLKVNAQRKTETEYVIHDGLERYYELYVPKAYSEQKSYPLLFVFHGGGGRADRMARFTGYRFNELADKEDFIVVYPNGYQKGWNDGARDTIAIARKLNIDDVGFFEAILTDLNEKLSVDRENIFVCGISNGGFMAQRLAFELSQKIKGIAVVAANLSVDQVQKQPPARPLSVLFMCGTHDPLVPYSGGHVTVFKQKRGEVLSVMESIEYWKQFNTCSVEGGKTVYPDKNKKDNCQATKTSWLNPGNPKIKVVDITVKNGGHTWPGTKQYLPRSLVGNTNRDFNGCDEIWVFFKSLMD